MKILTLLIFTTVLACKNDQEVISENKISNDQELVTIDSTQNPVIKNPVAAAVFEIVPQEISAGKGRSVFTQNGKTLFYMEQNSNKGNIKIDGKDYTLNIYDFNENNYTLSGNEVKIEATNGDFKDQTGDCVNGIFPDVKVTLNGKVLNLSNVNVQDCPDF
ncbi:MAG: hypothetical protein IAE62_06090 [Flavobacteriales bacterium]|nr:hypothetical protein [Flavobacteriales bacterium]